MDERVYKGVSVKVLDIAGNRPVCYKAFMGFADKLTKKVFPCPSCQKKLRVPIRMGKTLMVSCPKCTTSFNIQFKNPWSEFFQWYKGRGLLFNLKSFYYRTKLLPLGTRIMMVVILGLTLQAIIGISTSSLDKTNKPALKDPDWDQTIIKEI
ncbi:MAG: hypothetical protein EP319_11605 [Deltaproteobacteria bacterium]|nr:MAG: hypothetical protein EP319_11605 [Deltaproteobacteria bacterium]